jgi:hypothetical protein
VRRTIAKSELTLTTGKSESREIYNNQALFVAQNSSPIARAILAEITFFLLEFFAALFVLLLF